MLEFIHMIEPYVVGLCLVVWEVFIGSCFWMAAKSDATRYVQPVSGDQREIMSRSRVQDDATTHSRSAHVPATSA